jgi:hypothetical protein
MGAETDADVRVAWSPRGNPAHGTGHGRPILWQLRNSGDAQASPVLPGAGWK